MKGLEPHIGALFVIIQLLFLLHLLKLLSNF